MYITLKTLNKIRAILLQFNLIDRLFLNSETLSY